MPDMPTVDRPYFRDWNEPNVRRRWQEAPKTAVAGPAWAIIAVAVVGLVILGLSQGYQLFLWATRHEDFRALGPPTVERVVWEAVSMAQGAVQLAGMVIAILGARKMLRLESYGMAMSAAVLMMIPWVSPCCLLGLPFGIWAITVLNRSQVREAFQS